LDKTPANFKTRDVILSKLAQYYTVELSQQ
jgi:hypothetical protein